MRACVTTACIRVLTWLWCVCDCMQKQNALQGPITPPAVQSPTPTPSPRQPTVQCAETIRSIPLQDRIHVRVPWCRSVTCTNPLSIMLANALLILLQQEPNVAAQTRERRRERLAAIKKSAGAETKVAATHTHVEHLNKCLMAKCPVICMQMQ